MIIVIITEQEFQKLNIPIYTGRVVTMNTKYPTFLFFKNYLCLFKGVKILTHRPNTKQGNKETENHSPCLVVL